MSLKRYLVHLSVLGLVCTAAAFAYPFAGQVGNDATYSDGQSEGRLSAGVASVQQRTVQLGAEMRETKLGNREHRAANPVSVPTVAFDARWLDVEEEIRRLQDEHVRFLAVLAARESHAAGACLETP